VYRDGMHGEADSLASCYRTCLALAEQHGAATLSFPSISTGAYRYPIREAAVIALREVARHLEKKDTKLREVTFVLFSQSDCDVYASLL